ncbi:hypothetical protein FB451DRAFT_1272607 [Mycena latifolia]|nr:hypothetical protein FB451DRAFT_1272607 [Mycena latifolia]
MPLNLGFIVAVHCCPLASVPESRRFAHPGFKVLLATECVCLFLYACFTPPAVRLQEFSPLVSGNIRCYGSPDESRFATGEARVRGSTEQPHHFDHPEHKYRRSHSPCSFSMASLLSLLTATVLASPTAARAAVPVFGHVQCPNFASFGCFNPSHQSPILNFFARSCRP